MICVDRKLNSVSVIDALTDLFILRGPPAFVRSDNGSEFTAQAVRDRIAAVQDNGPPTAMITVDLLKSSRRNLTAGDILEHRGG